MNDSSTGPLVIGLLFIVRCLIPLGILFGISYLLQRLGLIDNRSGEKKIGSAGNDEKETPDTSVSSGSAIPPDPGSKKKPRRKKTAAPNKRSRNQ